MHRLPGLHGGVQVAERPAADHTEFFAGAGIEPSYLDANNYTPLPSTRSPPAPSPFAFPAPALHALRPSGLRIGPARDHGADQDRVAVVFDSWRCRLPGVHARVVIPKYDYENRAP
jgi:hypothetical protein